MSSVHLVHLAEVQALEVLERQIGWQNKSAATVATISLLV